MQRREAIVDPNASDDEDSYEKQLPNGRRRGATFPVFLPELARRTSLVELLYHSHGPRRDSSIPRGILFRNRPSAAEENPASVARKRALEELARSMTKKLPPVRLHPMPSALEKRRANEERTALSLQSRIVNSSPRLSHRILEARLQDAHEHAAAERVKRRSKAWYREALGAEPPRCETCPPSLGLTEESKINVDYRFAEKPWEDPKIAEIAAHVMAESAGRRPTNKQLVAPPNDASSEPPPAFVYHYPRC